jgi:hypothetical protein
MNREERQVFFKEVRRAVKEGAPRPTLLAMLQALPDDSEKAKYFRERIRSMI